jgi:hypothetical protein
MTRSVRFPLVTVVVAALAGARFDFPDPEHR